MNAQFTERSERKLYGRINPEPLSIAGGGEGLGAGL